MQRLTMPEGDPKLSADARARAARIAAMSQRLAAAGPRTRQRLNGIASVPATYLVEPAAAEWERGLDPDPEFDPELDPEDEPSSDYVLPDAVREALATFGWADAVRWAQRAALLSGAAVAGFGCVLAGLTLQVPNLQGAGTMVAGLWGRHALSPVAPGTVAPAARPETVAAALPPPGASARSDAGPKLVLAAATVAASDPPPPAVFARPVPLPPVESAPLAPMPAPAVAPATPVTTAPAAAADTAPEPVASPPANVPPAPAMVAPPKPSTTLLASARLVRTPEIIREPRILRAPPALELAATEHRVAAGTLLAAARGSAVRQSVASGRRHSVPARIQPALDRFADTREGHAARFALPRWLVSGDGQPARTLAMSPPPRDLALPAAPVKPEPPATSSVASAAPTRSRPPSALPPIPPARGDEVLTASSDDVRPAPPAPQQAYRPPAYSYGYGYPGYGYGGGGYGGYYGGYAPSPYYPGYYGSGYGQSY